MRGADAAAAGRRRTDTHHPHRPLGGAPGGFRGVLVRSGGHCAGASGDCHGAEFLHLACKIRISLKRGLVEPDPRRASPQTHISMESSRKDEFGHQIWRLG